MRRNSDSAPGEPLITRTSVVTLLTAGTASREVLHMLMRDPSCQVKGACFKPAEIFLEVANTEAEVVIVDLAVDVADVLAYLVSLRDQFPEKGILALSADVRPGTIEDAIRAGANGFLAHSELEDQLARALKYVRRQEIYVGEQNRGRLLQFLLVLSGLSAAALEEHLSRREFQVFQAIGEGKTLKEISVDLNLKHKTIETYRDRIKEKLRLRDSSQLMHYALRWAVRRNRSDA